MRYPKSKLGEVATIVTGSTPSKANESYWDGNIPFVTPSELDGDQDVISAAAYVTEEGASVARLVPKNSIMVCCIGSLGKLGVAGCDLLTNQQINTLVFDPKKVDFRYGYHFCKTLKPYLERIAPSTTIAIVNKSRFSEIEIPLPPLEEQKRIAAILDKGDGLRRKRAQAIALADDFLRATFLDMFGDPVTNPKGWDTVKLEELIASGPTNGLYKPSSDYVDSDGDLGTPILRIDGFYNGKIAKGYKFKRVLIDDQTRAKYLLQDGSIVINRVNSKEYVGKAMLVSGLRDDTVFESNMMNFSVDLGRVNPRFLVDQLADEFVRRQVAVMRKDAVNQSSINQQDVKSIEIRLPKLAQQENYAEIAEVIDNLGFKFNGISVDLEHFLGSLHECLLASQAR